MIRNQGYCDNHAKAMTDLDFSPGDRVAVWLPESAEKVGPYDVIWYDVDINICDPAHR
jgi:hypothetical protein